MPFGNIVSGSSTFEPRSPGVYSLNTLTFGDPVNEFRIRGASKSKDQLMRGSVTRILEKDVTISTGEVRKQLIVALSIASPSSDFTSAEIDALAGDISTFFTTSTVTRFMMGES